MKYRVVVEKDNHTNSSRYKIQKKVLFFWLDYKEKAYTSMTSGTACSIEKRVLWFDTLEDVNDFKLKAGEKPFKFYGTTIQPIVDVNNKRCYINLDIHGYDDFYGNTYLFSYDWFEIRRMTFARLKSSGKLKDTEEKVLNEFIK